MFCLRVTTVLTIVCLALTPIMGQSSTDQCCVSKEIFVPNANVWFAFIMSVRKNDTTAENICSLISKEALQNYLAAEWVVERVNNANNGTGFIPGITFGFYGMDDCRSPLFASRNSMYFLDPLLPQNAKGCNGSSAQSGLNIGIIGPSRTSTAMRVASLIRDIKIPIISMSSTSAALSDKINYPTFLRTVPSDMEQMKMIADMLHEFAWSYVVVIYEDDDYGRSGKDILTEKAKERGICIFRSLPLSQDVDPSRDLIDFLGKTKDNSLGVVFIGGLDRAEQLLWKIDKNLENNLGNVEGKNMKYGLHIILSDATNTDTSIYKNKNYGKGTVTISTSSVFLEDVYTDLVDKFQQVKDKKMTHELIEEYMSQNPNQDLFERGKYSTFIPSTVHAVFTLIDAFRKQHKISCHQAVGLCPKLETDVIDGDLLKTVFSNKVEYGKMDKGVPPDIFWENKHTASFDRNGDFEQTNKVPSYSVYQYRGQNQYEKIGNYTDGVTALEISKISMPTVKDLNFPTIPTSVCSGQCDSCLNNGMIPIAFMEGDAYILGVFSPHEADEVEPFQCGSFRRVANDAIIAEGFLYAVRELRKTTGINFGAIGIDDCYSPLRVTSILSDYFSGLANSDIFSDKITIDKLVGVVACRSSGCTIPTASFFMPLKVPVVSYAASSPDLDDKIDYPYFLRTVPSDVYLAEVMLKIVQSMGLEYVGLMYVKNNYGAKAMEAFKKLALQDDSGVCVAKEIGISEKESALDNREFLEVWTKLNNQAVKVVVFIGIDVRYRKFLAYLEEERRFGKFIFLASEDWGNNAGILNSGPKSARGSLTLKVENIGLETGVAFKNYLSQRSPTPDDSNIWFTEFWQNLFQCNFKGGFINTFSKDCDPSLKINEDLVNQLTDEQRVKHVITAVYAVGKGLKEAKQSFCEDKFPCTYLRQYADDVLEIIKKQNREQENFEYSVFNEQGNGAIGYEVYNIQQINGNNYDYVKVGTFNSRDTMFEVGKLTFYTDTGIQYKKITSNCTQFLCAHCPKRKAPVTDETVGKASTTDYRDPDILIISLVVALILAVVIIALVICICYRKVLKKNLNLKEEQIYAEPERRVYQDYLDTHGIQFANERYNPYPQMGTGALSHANSSPGPLIRGISNQGFTHDNIDSVSQVVAARQQRGMSQPDLRSRIRGDVNTPTMPIHYLSRPLPVSPIGNRTMSNIMQDNQAYNENTSSENTNSVVPSIAATYNNGSEVSSHPSNRPMSMRPISPRSQNNEHLHTAMPRGVVPANESNQPENIVYYMQGSNGQLEAHVSSSVQENSSESQEPHHRPSITPQSSVVEEGYGPYSRAAVIQRKMQRQGNQQNESPLQHNGSQPLTQENIELHEMGTNNTHPHANSESERSDYSKKAISVSPQSQQNDKPHFPDSGVEYSPIHYASPSHSSQSPSSNETNSSQYNSTQPQANVPRGLQFTNLHPMVHTSIPNPTPQPVVNPNYQQPQQQHQLSEHEQQQQQQMLQQYLLQNSQPYSPDGQAYITQNKTLSPVPDVVGDTTPTTIEDRPLSMESVDLSSSKESLDNLASENQKPVYKNNMRLATLSTYDGDISKV